MAYSLPLVAVATPRPARPVSIGVRGAHVLPPTCAVSTGGRTRPGGTPPSATSAGPNRDPRPRVHMAHLPRQRGPSRGPPRRAASIAGSRPLGLLPPRTILASEDCAAVAMRWNVGTYGVARVLRASLQPASRARLESYPGADTRRARPG